jgi:hypothetical protein
MSWEASSKRERVEQRYSGMGREGAEDAGEGAVLLR